MRYMNATQAAKVIGVTDRTIREWIRDGKLTAHHPSPNRLAIAVTDIERIARERKQYDVSIPDANQIAERLAAIEQRQHELEQQYAQIRQELEARIEAPAAPTTLDTREYHRTRTPTTSTEKALPLGAIHVRDFATMHGVNQNTFVSQLKVGIRGEIPPHTSRPKPGRPSETERFLMPEQQAGVFEYWRRHGVRFEEQIHERASVEGENI